MPDRTGHLADEEAAAFVAGTLENEARGAVEVHVDGCADCRRLLSALAPTDDDPSATEDEEEQAPPTLTPGTVLGRFVVRRRIGAGGMGVVYAAYDPDLDREVALKLFNAREGVDDGEARLVREAKAMARVAHPNVVAAHDVGVAFGRVFLAMELVDGVTLRAWLRETRSTTEILRVFVEAGRGIAAAHSKGLVHRDFKPDNVLVGKDGRTRVTDFGLARGVADRESLRSLVAFAEETQRTAEPLVTRAGALVGTPAYMAPEQHEGAPADARSDQYAFAVTLHQALFGKLYVPRAPWPKTARRVPRAVRHILGRALATDPKARYPSMDALLGDLVSIPGRERRWRLVAITIGLLALVVVGLVFQRQRAMASLCVEEEPVPSGAELQAITRAFAGTKKSFASDAFVEVQRGLTAYGSRLAAARRTSCEATRLRHEQSEETHALRTACLDRRRDEVRALVDVLTTADAIVVEHAPGAVRELTPLDVCSGPSLAAEPLPPPKSIRVDIDTLHRELAAIRALGISGKVAPARAESLVTRARTVGYGPLLAEALLVEGTLKDDLGELAQAETVLYEAAGVAEAEHHDRIAAEAWTALVRVVAADQARRDAGNTLLRVAEAALARAGRPADLAAFFEGNLHALLAAEGRYADARTHAETALSLAERAFGDDHPYVARILDYLERLVERDGGYDSALAFEERALAIRRRLYGPRHPEVARSLANLGWIHLHTGRYAEARAACDEAIAIDEEAFGPNSPTLSVALDPLGLVFLGEGRPDEATPLIARALRLERDLHPEHPSVAGIEAHLARAYAAQGRLADAEAMVEGALALERRLLRGDHPSLVETLTTSAAILRAEGRRDLALRRADEAVAIAEIAFGPSGPRLADALAERGACRAALDDPGGARADLGHAVSMMRAIAGDPVTEAEAAFTLARALAPADRTGAVREARAAREKLERSGKQDGGVAPTPRVAALDRDLARWIAKTNVRE